MRRRYKNNTKSLRMLESGEWRHLTEEQLDEMQATAQSSMKELAISDDDLDKAFDEIGVLCPPSRWAVPKPSQTPPDHTLAS